MDFSDIKEIKKAGFVGFKTIRDLVADNSDLPGDSGVYMILNLQKNYPVFLHLGTGGYFKRKDPNVSLQKLKDEWVENTIVVYIGKATSLRFRLKQYLAFGQGKNVGHRGGRLIWQLDFSDQLVVCWKILPDCIPRTIETELINNFKEQFGVRPFANLVD